MKVEYINNISKDILHTEKSPDEISAIMGNHIEASKRGRGKKISGFYVDRIGDFIIELRKKLENLVSGGDEVNVMLDCDKENELHLGFSHKIYGFGGYTLDSKNGELLVDYKFSDGLSGVKQLTRSPTSYEVALFRQLSKHK